MAGDSIKLFQFNQKYCQMVGIKAPKTIDNRNKLELKQLIFAIFAILFEIELLAFLVNDAESMGEYGITIYFLCTALLALFDHSMLIWTMEDILKFTEYCEAFIEKSKSTFSCWLHSEYSSNCFSK